MGLRYNSSFLRFFCLLGSFSYKTGSKSKILVIFASSEWAPPNPPPPQTPPPHLAPPRHQKQKSRGQPTECPCKKSWRSDEKRLKYSTFRNFVQNGYTHTDRHTHRQTHTHTDTPSFVPTYTCVFLHIQLNHWLQCTTLITMQGRAQISDQAALRRS